MLVMFFFNTDVQVYLLFLDQIYLFQQYLHD